MFIKLVYNGSGPTRLVNGRRVRGTIFTIIDSCFSADIECLDDYLTNHVIVEKLIDVYAGRKLNVINVLVKFYKWLELADFDVRVLIADSHFQYVHPKYGYQKTYYPLLRFTYFPHLFH